MKNNKWLALTLAVIAVIMVFWRLVPGRKPKPGLSPTAATVMAGPEVTVQDSMQNLQLQKETRADSGPGPLVDPDSPLLWRPVHELPQPEPLDLSNLQKIGFPIFSRAPFDLVPVAARKEASRPEFKLEAIVIEGPRRLALINGQIVAEGDEIEGARVLSIAKGQVLLMYAEQALRLVLGPETPQENYPEQAR